MKLLNYRKFGYGIGTNPSGGVMVEVQPETHEEAELLGFQSIVVENFSGVEKPVRKIVYKNLVKHIENVPLGGGINPMWQKLEDFLGEDPLLWAEKQAR